MPRKFMFILLLLIQVLAYPTVEDLIREDYELIETILDVTRKGPKALFESSTVGMKDNFASMFGRIIDYVDFCSNNEKRSELVLSIIIEPNYFTNETMPRFDWSSDMRSSDAYFVYKQLLCALCQYLDYFSPVTAVVATKKLRNGDACHVLNKFYFDSSMGPCSCYE